MTLLVLFFLGAGNFAMHRAVLSSGHRLVHEVPEIFRRGGGRVGLLVEYLLLAAAMLLAHYVSPYWAWAYVGYTLLNSFSAWMILTRRV